MLILFAIIAIIGAVWWAASHPDDDWWDLMGDPFIPEDYKQELMQRFPEKFPSHRE